MTATRLPEYTSAQEASNRIKKARRLAKVLKNHGATPEQAKALPAAGWSMAARLAGTKVPSPLTVAYACAELELMLERRPTRPPWGDDPFSVLPKVTS